MSTLPGGAMLCMIVGLAFAENEATQKVDSVDPAAMAITATERVKLSSVRATLEPYGAKLRETLATEGWWQTPAEHAPEVTADIWTVVEPDLDGSPEFYRAENAVGVTRTVPGGMGEARHVRSNAKLLGDSEKPDTIAYGQQTLHYGRGTTVTSRDVMVVYTDGKPSHIYTSSSQNWTGQHLESLWTLKLDAAGQIVGADELTAGNPTVGGQKDWERVAGIQRTWTRTR